MPAALPPSNAQDGDPGHTGHHNLIVAALAEQQTHGPHLVTWDGANWRYLGTTISARPTTATYSQGSYIVWDTSLDVNAQPPTLAVAGDKWNPHPDAVI